MCEVQEDDQILGYITSAMNTILGKNVYTYVTDGMQGSKSSSGYMQIKSGFIYRCDKIATVGGNTSPYKTWDFKPRMRIQAFKELATDEKFVLSMNHFKAKTSGTDEERLANATTLVNGLTWITTDPDILIMGDLNATTEEEAIQKIINSGYAEQLVRFDENAYSYVYHNQEQLIDHVMANSTMASQITGAYVYHINNDPAVQSSAMIKKYNFSDHDACLVGLCLGTCSSEGIEYHMSDGTRAKKTIENGRLVLTFPDGTTYNVTGVRIR
jgi:predicted extracellular nuclease